MNSASESIPFRESVPGAQPANNSPEYGSTHKRHPKQPPLRIPQALTEIAGPRFLESQYPSIIDVSRNGSHEAMGERIIVRGRVVDEDNRPVPHTIIEIWQANAAGRYNQPGDTHDAPLDPNFRGEGRVFSDADGWYQFATIKAGGLSLAQPLQCVAAQPHPFLPLRGGIRHAADHSDVLPRRPAAGARSDLQQPPRSAGAGPAGCHVRY
jgi:protocatechuate 3,4-dioxygenase beta subunit